MGERGANREPATERDRARMAELTLEGMKAGAFGFATSRTLNHRAADGRHIPTLRAEEAELTAIARAMRIAGAGWLQIVSDFQDQQGEIGLFRRLARESGRPVTITMIQSDAHPEGWRELMKQIDDANGEGLRITAQIRSRPTSVLLGLELTQNPFMGRPSYRTIAHLPIAERVEILRQPEFRARLLAEAYEGSRRGAERIERWDRMFPLGDPPNYEPAEESSLGAQARREDRDPREIVYDYLIANEGRNFIFAPFANFAAYNLDCCSEMMQSPYTLIGLGDGGAHVGLISDGSFPTTLLAHWGRDRARGTLDQAWLVKRQTSDNARAVGLMDRGVLAPGYKADLNVIDFDKLVYQLIIIDVFFNVILTLVTDEVPQVEEARRVEEQSLAEGFHRVVGHYGFMEEPDVPALLARCRIDGKPIEVNTTTNLLTIGVLSVCRRCDCTCA